MLKSKFAVLLLGAFLFAFPSLATTLIEQCRMGECYRVVHLKQRLLRRSPQG